MREQQDNKISFENAHIMYLNFSGAKTQYNAEGKRNFCVRIDDENLVETLREDGWNVKERPPRDEDDKPMYFLKVNVNYNGRPPKIWMITEHGRTLLDEDTVGELDSADIVNVDLIVRPYKYDVRGSVGISAYVQVMYVTIEEDEFAAKYLYDDDPDDVPFDA